MNILGRIVLAVGVLIAILLYLFAPVMAMSQSIFAIPMNGCFCMKISWIYVIPLVLCALAFLFSFLPAQKAGCFLGIVAAISMLVIAICGADIMAKNIENVRELSRFTNGSESSNYYVNQIASLLFDPGWGLIVGLIVITLNSIVALFLSKGSNGAKTNPPRTSRNTSTGTTARTMDYRSLNRH